MYSSGYKLKMNCVDNECLPLLIFQRILKLIQDNSFIVVKSKQIWLTREQVETFYGEHKGMAIYSNQ